MSAILEPSISDCRRPSQTASMIGSSYFVPLHPFSMARISASDGICISALTLLGSVVRSVTEGPVLFQDGAQQAVGVRHRLWGVVFRQLIHPTAESFPG